MNSLQGIPVDWPAPERVRTFSSLRAGGVSRGCWGLPSGDAGGLNLGLHVGDVPEHVRANRERLREVVGMPIQWLEQVHGTHVLDVDDQAGVGLDQASSGPIADAAVSGRSGRALCIMTADCLPVLLTDHRGRCIGAAHAGWRGLHAGVLEATVAAMRARLGRPLDLLAWFGPAIGPRAFEVGAEVRDAFVSADREAVGAFVPAPAQGKWLASLEMLARQRLAKCGGIAVYGGGMCTVSDPARFYSHRRDRTSGRMASLIWLAS